jgi:hypothetical protein
MARFSDPAAGCRVYAPAPPCAATQPQLGNTMELRQLEYFIAIAEAGSFSRAAVRLRVGQPVLSRQIKALEAELGTDLYYRNGRGIVLTEAGKILEQHARGALDTTAGARRAIHALVHALGPSRDRTADWAQCSPHRSSNCFAPSSRGFPSA